MRLATLFDYMDVTTVEGEPEFTNPIYNESTPIEEIGGLYFKRDDLYKPFSDSPLNGTKLRQIQMLFDSRKSEIKTKYNSTVLTACSVHSPQAANLARAAKEFNFKVVVGVGVKSSVEDVLKRRPMMKYAHDLGAEIRIVAGTGYNNVIYSRLSPKEGFIVRFGFQLSDNYQALVGSVSNQTKNLPPNCYLIVPMGSGVTFSGIIEGIELMDKEKRPRKITAIQISGYDRSKETESLLNNIRPYGRTVDYEILVDKTYPYTKQVNSIWGSLQFDYIYEAKAFQSAERLNLLKESNVCFWVIGNNNSLR